MHIAIAITIAITLAATLAQQAHGWAQSCADGNTDVCCHLEQIGWKIDTLISATMTIRDRSSCDPWAQSVYDETIPRMCATDCWGGAVGLEGSWSTMATQADVLRTACKVNYFINGTCPPAQQSSSSSTAAAFSSTASASVSSTASAPVSSTASAPVSSTASAPVSSTASATESSSSSSSTGTNTDDRAGASASMGPTAEDPIGAAAPQTRAHWAFALACALMLWH